MLKMYCPLCKLEINVSKGKMQIECPVCGWRVPAKIKNVECLNCKAKNKIIMPENSQIWEVYLVSIPCPKKM